MKGYWPISLETGIAVASLSVITIVLCFLVTYKLSQKIARILAWFSVFFNVGFMHWFCLAEPAGIRMLAFCFVLLFAMKAVVLAEEQAGKPQKLSWISWCIFTLAWAGMKPSLFLNPQKEALPGAVSMILGGVLRIFIGLSLIALAYYSWPRTQSYVLITFLLLPGLSLAVHFGTFNTLAGIWRLFGYDCKPLFIAPLYSTSLSEFWGRRWNMAYSEMVNTSVYRPFSQKFGKTPALLASFTFSGLLHEVAISLPVQSWYGIPSLYFVAHGVLTWVERKLSNKGIPIDQKKWLGWCWTCFWLLLPAPFLFHPPFLAGTAWPIIGIF